MTDRPFFAKKGTILIPSGSQPTSDTEHTKHLHFVCSDVVFYPDTAKNSMLVVNVTSIRHDIDHDKTCILNTGDHPFIKRPSYIYYRKSAIIGADTTAKKIDAGEFSVHEPCSDILFRRIISGFNISDEIQPEILRFFNKYCQE